MESFNNLRKINPHYIFHKTNTGGPLDIFFKKVLKIKSYSSEKLIEVVHKLEQPEAIILKSGLITIDRDKLREKLNRLTIEDLGNGELNENYNYNSDNLEIESIIGLHPLFVECLMKTFNPDWQIEVEDNTLGLNIKQLNKVASIHFGLSKSIMDKYTYSYIDQFDSIEQYYHDIQQKKIYREKPLDEIINDFEKEINLQINVYFTNFESGPIASIVQKLREIEESVKGCIVRFLKMQSFNSAKDELRTRRNFSEMQKKIYLPPGVRKEISEFLGRNIRRLPRMNRNGLENLPPVLISHGLSRKRNIKAARKTRKN